jgi:hypothetical protein
MVNLDECLNKLCCSLHRVAEVIGEVTVSLSDAPADSSLGDRLSDALTEASSAVAEAEELCTLTTALATRERGADRLRMLGQIHDLCRRTGVILRDDTIQNDRIVDLRDLGRRRGEPWLQWTRVVEIALTSTLSPLQDLDRQVLHSWLQAVAITSSTTA